jgi:hypothetical protein
MTNTQTKPAMVPGEFTKSGNSEASMPKLIPPSVAFGSAIADETSVTAEKTETAPSISLVGGTVSGITAWQNSKKINALWSINQDKNSWVGVEGLGWKRLSNVSATGIVALTMLAAHAFEKGSIVNYRDESDGMIHEIYVW